MQRTILGLALASGMLAATPAMSHDRDHHHYRTTDNGIRYWQGRDGRYYCKRPNGTDGMLIGGATGALVCRTLNTPLDRS